MPTQATANSRYQLILEAQYGRIYNGLQARLFERTGAALNTLGLVAGTAAFASASAANLWLGAAAGAVVAILPIIGQVADFRGKALISREQEQRFFSVLCDVAQLDDAALERRLWEARGTDYVEGLRRVSHNRALVENGHTETMPLTRWERLLGAIA